MPARERISDSALDELRSRNPVPEYAGKGVRLRKSGSKWIGPCPIHSPDPQARDSTSFECWADGWVCATCEIGGDVISLVQKVEGKTFLEAVEWLGGAPEINAARAAELDEARKRKEVERERESARYREKERGALWDIWLRAGPVAGPPADRCCYSSTATYFRLRDLEVPPGVRLRCVPDMPYFVPRGRDQVVIHRGPALVAPIMRPDAHFGGLHFTYIDLSQPKGKLAIADPETGEQLPAKKVRGSKRGGYIDLVRCKRPRRLVIGEGIETVLSVWTALTALGRDLSDTTFWSSVDLGNLGGKAADTVAHPTLKTAAGRAQRVPGPTPDMAAAGIPIPDSVEDVVILGDGDSDRLTTRCAIVRAAARFARPGRSVRVAWAPDGRDFNDLRRAA
jgi:hypothetical protein